MISKEISSRQKTKTKPWALFQRPQYFMASDTVGEAPVSLTHQYNLIESHHLISDETMGLISRSSSCYYSGVAAHNRM